MSRCQTRSSNTKPPKVAPLSESTRRDCVGCATGLQKDRAALDKEITISGKNYPELGSYDVSICAIISVGHDAGNGS